MKNLLRISEVSKRSGINIETIRYYEKIGALPPPLRADNGYRMYEPHVLMNLEFIKDCRALGFSMEEIKQLDVLRQSPQSDCSAVDGLVKNHLKKVQKKIAQLQEIERFLLNVNEPHEGNIKDCRIMQTLDTQSQYHKHIVNQR